MKKGWINHNRPSLDVSDAQVVQKAVKSGWVAEGSIARAFEREAALYLQQRYAKVTSSGTSALHLSLVASGIGRGDEVITVPNTFAATCAAIAYTGATPRLVDIESEYFNMDAKKLEKAITQKTKAIIPVHLYGQPCDMKEIKEIAEKRNIAIIEDACQAHGAEHYNKRMPYSEIGCFSFYPGKNLGAYGEGGSIVCNDKEFIEKIKAYRHHGQVKKNMHKYIGYNYRLEELQAAILRVKLRHLGNWNEMRRRNAKIYHELLHDSAISIPVEKSCNRHVYHLYVIRTKKREKMIECLNSKGIQSGIHYPIPIHLQEAYHYLNYKKGSFPVAEKYSNEILSLPMYPELKQDEISAVANAIKESND